MKARYLLFALAIAMPALAAQQPAPKPVSTQTPELKDRVMAVVDEDPILASEMDKVIALGLVQPREGEGDVQFRRRILNGLVEERLRFHEIDRFGFEQVPVDMIAKNVAQIRARFPNEEAYRKTLQDLGLSQQALRQLVARQLMVFTHVEEQLGPRVFVSLDDITAYYRNVLTPEMQKRGQPVPPMEEVRDQIRAVLKEQRLNQELAKWTEELRRAADIHVYFDKPAEQLPPVVKRIGKKDEFN
ncbi:MAG TPA: hypothetical protein VNM67_21830 [Thermoanaerobaculia bacterium]|jgi:hypothetical protein|nr:hypothetical protein [Thermoanaerobaculia bacterium]